MKIWECTLDLLDHLEKDSFQFDGLNVLLMIVSDEGLFN